MPAVGDARAPGNVARKPNSASWALKSPDQGKRCVDPVVVAQGNTLPWRIRQHDPGPYRGIFGVMIAAMVAALFLFVVRPAIDDTTDRALDAADRAIDDAARPTDQLRGQGDYLSAASFGAVVAQIREQVGADGELLDLTVSKQGGGNVKYRTGDRAAGFQWGPGRDGLEPVKITLIGPGKLADNVFPISKLDPDATTELAAAVKDKAGAGFDIQTMTLGLNPATGAVQWTVTGEGDGRSTVFHARSDASGLKQVS